MNRSYPIIQTDLIFYRSFHFMSSITWAFLGMLLNNRLRQTIEKMLLLRKFTESPDDSEFIFLFLLF